MTKPRKYAVFSKIQLRNMIKDIENKETLYDMEARETSTVVLYFQMASKKHSGQLSSIDRDGNWKGWY